MPQGKDIASSIFEDLKERILKLEYYPGMQLTEVDVCASYQVSKTPVRTAFQRLADLGLLDVLPYHKTRVSLIDMQNVKQYIYIRSALEDRLIRDLIRRADPLILEDIKHLIRKQELVVGQESFNPSDFYELDARMHNIWYKEKAMNGLWGMLNSSIHYTRIKMLDILDRKAFESIINEHKALLACIIDEDYEGVYPLLELHFNGGLKRLENQNRDKISSYFANI